MHTPQGEPLHHPQTSKSVWLQLLCGNWPIASFACSLLLSCSQMLSAQRWWLCSCHGVSWCCDVLESGYDSSLHQANVYIQATFICPWVSPWILRCCGNSLAAIHPLAANSLHLHCQLYCLLICCLHSAVSSALLTAFLSPVFAVQTLHLSCRAMRWLERCKWLLNIFVLHLPVSILLQAVGGSGIVSCTRGTRGHTRLVSLWWSTGLNYLLLDQTTAADVILSLLILGIIRISFYSWYLLKSECSNTWISSLLRLESHARSETHLQCQSKSG